MAGLYDWSVYQGERRIKGRTAAERTGPPGSEGRSSGGIRLLPGDGAPRTYCRQHWRRWRWSRLNAGRDQPMGMRCRRETRFRLVALTAVVVAGPLGRL